jgi:hypothetical protein
LNLKALNLDPEPKPEPQGITSIVEPTRKEEVEKYLKDRAAIMGDDEYAKALKARAEKEPSFFEKVDTCCNADWSCWKYDT